jgi:hypothetical protein
LPQFAGNGFAGDSASLNLSDKFPQTTGKLAHCRSIRARCFPRQHRSAAPASQFKPTFVGEKSICFGNSVEMNPEIGGKLTYRR